MRGGENRFNAESALASELAGQDRRTLAEHKRLLYGDVVRVRGGGQPGGQ